MAVLSGEANTLRSWGLPPAQTLARANRRSYVSVVLCPNVFTEVRSGACVHGVGASCRRGVHQEAWQSGRWPQLTDYGKR